MDKAQIDEMVNNFTGLLDSAKNMVNSAVTPEIKKQMTKDQLDLISEMNKPINFNGNLDPLSVLSKATEIIKQHGN